MRGKVEYYLEGWKSPEVFEINSTHCGVGVPSLNRLCYLMKEIIEEGCPDGHLLNESQAKALELVDELAKKLHQL